MDSSDILSPLLAPIAHKRMASGFSFTMFGMVARDGIEPPTPAFSECSY